MVETVENDDFDYSPPVAPYWRCESCGHESHTKAMPVDRQKFYDNIHYKGVAPKCPKCKSESFMPFGF